jgi:hypothetical protein
MQLGDRLATGGTYLKEHAALLGSVFTTYFRLRFGLALLALVFPLMLWIIGEWWFDIPKADVVNSAKRSRGYFRVRAAQTLSVVVTQPRKRSTL